MSVNVIWDTRVNLLKKYFLKICYATKGHTTLHVLHLLSSALGQIAKTLSISSNCKCLGDCIFPPTLQIVILSCINKPVKTVWLPFWCRRWITRRSPLDNLIAYNQQHHVCLWIISGLKRK